MQVAISAIGRMKRGPESELADRYLDRARAQGRNLGLTGFAVTEIAESRAASAAARKAEEAAALFKAVPDGALTVALDERGKAMDSPGFAEFIATRRDQGTRAMAFLIGGPDGLDKSVRGRADLILGLSPLTWPHQLVRIMLAEQLYRTTTILAGHPYHRA